MNFKNNKPSININVPTNSSQIGKLNYGKDVETIIYNSPYSSGHVYNCSIHWLMIDSCLGKLPVTFRPDDILMQIMSQFVTYNSYAETDNNSLHYVSELTTKCDFLAVLSNYLKTVENSNSILSSIPTFTTSTNIDNITVKLTAISNPKSHLGEMYDHTIFKVFEISKFITSIDIAGTVEDWNKITQFLDILSVYDRDGKLLSWISRIKNMIEKFILTLEVIKSKNPPPAGLFEWWKTMISIDKDSVINGYNASLSGWGVNFFTFCATNSGLQICDNFDSNGNPVLSQLLIPYSHDCVRFTNGTECFKLFSGNLILDGNANNGMNLKPMVVLTKLKQTLSVPTHNHKMIKMDYVIGCVCYTCCLSSKTVNYCPECNIHICTKCVANPDWRAFKENINHPCENHVTFMINSHDATVPNIKSADADPEYFKKIKRCFDRLKNTKPCIFPKDKNFEYCNNGFVSTILTAYNEHHNLYLRPDDIWITIMSQFCIYVLGNSETMRKMFVNHEGKIKAKSTVVFTGDVESTIGLLANNFLQNIKENVKPGIIDNMIPSFTTTTETDILSSIIGFMTLVKKYFVYDGCIAKCGIPNVTLYGTVDDWIKLKQMTLDLYKFNDETDRIKTWLDLVVETIDMMILTAQGNINKELLEWWNKICMIKSAGSNSEFLSGWITCYCMFDDSKGVFKFNKPGPGKWPVINIKTEIPTGIMIADVNLQFFETILKVQMCAGVIGISKVNHDVNGIAPKVSWFIVETDDVNQDILLDIKRAQHVSHADFIRVENSYHKCITCKQQKKLYGCSKCCRYECEPCMEKYKQITIADHDIPLVLKYRITKCHKCRSDIDVGYSLDTDTQLIDKNLRYDYIDGKIVEIERNIPITYCLPCIGSFYWINPDNKSRGYETINHKFNIDVEPHESMLELVHGGSKCGCKLVKYTTIPNNLVCDICHNYLSANSYGCEDRKTCDYDVCPACLHSLSEINLVDSSTAKNDSNLNFCLHTEDKKYFPEKYGNQKNQLEKFNLCHNIQVCLKINPNLMVTNGDLHLYYSEHDKSHARDIERFVQGKIINVSHHERFENIKNILKEYTKMVELERSDLKRKEMAKLISNKNVRLCLKNEIVCPSLDMQKISELSDEQLIDFMCERYTYYDVCYLGDDDRWFKINCKYFLKLQNNGYSNCMNLFKSLLPESDMYNQLFSNFMELSEYVMNCSGCNVQCRTYYTNLDETPTIYCFKCIKRFAWKSVEYRRTF